MKIIFLMMLIGFDVNCFLLVRKEYSPPAILFFGCAEAGVIVVEGKCLLLRSHTKSLDGEKRVIIHKKMFFLSISDSAVDTSLLLERKRFPQSQTSIPYRFVFFLWF